VTLIGGCIGCTRSWVAYDTLPTTRNPHKETTNTDRRNIEVGNYCGTSRVRELRNLAMGLFGCPFLLIGAFVIYKCFVGAGF